MTHRAAVALGVLDAKLAQLDKHALHSCEVAPQATDSKVTANDAKTEKITQPSRRSSKGLARKRKQKRTKKCSCGARSKHSWPNDQSLGTPESESLQLPRYAPTSKQGSAKHMVFMTNKYRRTLPCVYIYMNIYIYQYIITMSQQIKPCRDNHLGLIGPERLWPGSKIGVG